MKRAIRSLLRLIAAALMLLGLVEAGLEFAEFKRHQREGTDIGFGALVIGLILLVAGAVLLSASSRLAEKIGRDFEE
jgi:hypothetical protein